ncbi:hypothetical protein AVEN_66638-1 [Araneus ventricosus]|uniref:Uncharacterized protein n=1 Tax=Araneus ventricosus TaxID=182803 RepID=A0A4Y2QDE2_ARAVE|nr:hypothetical protein AVEN_66638-1 [Araneus ventricosus]
MYASVCGEREIWLELRKSDVVEKAELILAMKENSLFISIFDEKVDEPPYPDFPASPFVRESSFVLPRQCSQPQVGWAERGGGGILFIPHLKPHIRSDTFHEKHSPFTSASPAPSTLSRGHYGRVGRPARRGGK